VEKGGASVKNAKTAFDIGLSTRWGLALGRNPQTIDFSSVAWEYIRYGQAINALAAWGVGGTEGFI
jgi:hypothetical protein